jgi:hypothetical protein
MVNLKLLSIKKLELKLELNYTTLKNFRIGAEFTKNELLQYTKEFRTPEDWTLQEVLQSIKHNWKEDFCHLTWYFKIKFIKLKYIVDSIKITKNFLYIVMVITSPIFLGLALANTMPDKILTNEVSVKKEVRSQVEKTKKSKKTKTNTKSKSLEDKAKLALKEEARKLKEVRNLHKELQKELGIEELPKKPLKPVNEIVTLPEIKLPEVLNETTVPNNLNKDVFLTDAQFKLYIKTIVYPTFKKMEDDYRINAITESGRHSYEAWVRGTRTINKVRVNVWIPSNLFLGVGNGSGIKVLGKNKIINHAWVWKVDDKVDCNAKGESRFMVFQRNNFYDIQNWARYHVGVVLANKDYYNPERRNYKDIVAYSYEFEKYATKIDYCKTLLSRSLMVQKIINN